MKTTPSQTGRLPLPGRIGLGLALLASASGTEVAALLVVVAATSRSRVCGLAVALVLVLSAWWCLASLRPLSRRPTATQVAAVLVTASGLLAWCIADSPSEQLPPGTRGFGSVFRSPQRFRRLSPAWIVPERDQVRLGGLVLPWVDPHLSREQGKRFRLAFDCVYAALERCKDFADAGSAMGEAYANMFLGAGPVGHMYVYYPAASGRLPVLVFLHGWLGNLKAYSWAWREFADLNGFAIIAPTFGNGVWLGQQADDILQWTAQVIRADGRLDPGRVFVVGLSNGGTGVTRWATLLRETYQGLVYLSPVMRGTAESPDFVSAVGTRPLLVVHGGDDNRIPPGYVLEQVAELEAAGVRVERLCYSGEDHVLVLTARKRLHADLRRWIDGTCRGQPDVLDGQRPPSG